VTGIVSGGRSGAGDRYTYLPQIRIVLPGLICGAAGVTRVVAGRRLHDHLMALIFCARAQTALLRNRERWDSTLACTSDNFIGHNNLGTGCSKRAMWTKRWFITKSAGNQTRLREAHNNLGNFLFQKGSVDEAMVHYKWRWKSIRLAEAHYNLGNALLQNGQCGRSDRPFPKGPANQSRLRGSHNNLGYALIQREEWTKRSPISKGPANQSDYADAHNNLATFCSKREAWTKRSSISKGLQIKTR